jgi:catechol 2,3-dioxygenase-like lactoylglutathione lyase family enzyme
MSVLSLKTKITTPRVAETVSWYRDLLGLEVVEEWNEPGDKGVILALPAGEAFLEVYEGPSVSGFSDVSLQIRVEDVDSFPVPDDPRFVSRGPVDRPWGSRYLFFTDPNGISVVLFSGSAF